MPIRIPDSLPATATLESENIFVMTEHRAMHQDIRPLRLVILNLMPTKITTETQLLRKLSNTPLQINVDLLQVVSHEAKNISEKHLESFYCTFNDIKCNRYDGMIITGAPVENLNFEDVDYWDELCQIMEWSKKNVHCTLHICWGAQAGLYYHYGLQKRQLPQKLFGVFEHNVLKPNSPFFRDLTSMFFRPPFSLDRDFGRGYSHSLFFGIIIYFTLSWCICRKKRRQSPVFYYGTSRIRSRYSFKRIFP